MSDKRFNRRKLILASGASVGSMLMTNPFDMLFQGIARRLITDAALGQSATEKNYVCLLQFGAPPRWHFDSFLNPNNSISDVIPNTSVTNAMGSPGNLASDYTGQNSASFYANSPTPYTYMKDGQVKTIWLPLLIDAPIPEWNGSAAVFNSKPVLVRDLLKNCMVVRGIDMGVDVGHYQGPHRIIQPSASDPSISGVIADGSQRMIPAIGYVETPGMPIGFVAQKASLSAAASNTTSANGPLYDILSAFFIDTSKYPTVSQHASNQAKMQAAMNNALNTMQAYAVSNNPGSGALYASFKNAQALFSQAATEFTNLKSSFMTSYNKYVALCNASRQPVLGLIPAMQGDSPYASYYATTLALAEFLISNGLAASYTLWCGSDIRVGTTVTNSKSISYFFDEHDLADRQMSLILHNYRYRSMFACLNEFKKAIGDGAFANTVIHNGAEFGRDGLNDGSGSAHAVTANSMTIMSGAITNFIPIGNIKKQLYSSGLLIGTSGDGAPTLVPTTSSLIDVTHGMVASSILDLLGKPHLNTRDNSLIARDSGGAWVSITEDPKNV